MHEFQIVTPNETSAAQFMAAVQAADISIEDWSGVWPGEAFAEYVCSFGVTNYGPHQLNRLADTLGVALIYVKPQDADG